MSITLDHEMDTPDGNTVRYGIAHQHENSYAGVDVACSWEQSASASLTYWCAWDDVAQFMMALVGDCSVIDNAGTKEFSRFLPHKYPATAFYNLWCSGITSIKGIPGRDATDATIIYPTYSDLVKLTYRYAAVTAKYEPAIWPMKTDEETDFDKEWTRFTSITKTPRLEFLTVQVGSFFWIDSPPKQIAPGVGQSALPHPIPLREQSVDWVVTFHRCPEAFFSPSDYIGYTNDADEFLAGHPQVRATGFPMDTMLLLGVNEIILPTCFREEPYYTYQYLFQERTNTHNKVRRYMNKKPGTDEAITPTYDYNAFSLDGLPLTSGTTNNRVFKQASMGALFLPNA